MKPFVLPWLGFAVLAVCPVQAQPQGAPAATAPTPPPASAPAPRAGSEQLGYVDDPYRRMTVSVSLAGQGPYQFIVDTGAENTVVSEELARQLALPDSGRTTLQSVDAIREVSTVRIPSLEVGRRAVRNLRAPVLQRHNLGAEGLLGLDSLQSQSVTFDFIRRELSILPSRGRQASRGRVLQDGTIVVTGRSRLGRLIIADASVGGQRVSVIIDTGSSVTVGNSALRNRLLQSGRVLPTGQISLTSVTGGEFAVDYSLAGRIRIGGASIEDMPIGFADAQIFARLGLADRPALLLGMDALRLFDRISIDFASRQVSFRIPVSGVRPLTDRRMAAMLPAAAALR